MKDQEVTLMLREKGFKVTPQRLAVYQALKQSTEHPSAEMLFERLKKNFPTMSLATVYKTLDVLEEIGFIQRLNVGEDSFRYDSWTENHPHIRCSVCGKVEDLLGVDAAPFLEAIRAQTEYEVTGQQFYFFGICKNCQTKPQ